MNLPTGFILDEGSLDADRALYIIDSGSNCVRMFPLSGNNLEKYGRMNLGKCGAAGYDGDGDQAFAAKLNLNSTISSGVISFTQSFAIADTGNKVIITRLLPVTYTHTYIHTYIHTL